MIINDLDDYYIVFDTKNRNTELDTLVLCCLDLEIMDCIIWMSVKYRLLDYGKEKRLFFE